MRLMFKQYNKKKDVNKNVNWLMKSGKWGRILNSQKLSERFIEKHKDKVNWYFISMYQKLSEGFIERLCKVRKTI